MSENEAIRRAIALSYDEENAPTVCAKGSAELADEIIALAKEHNIPLMENGYLLELLMSLELDESIPEALYLSVAEIIAFAYWLSGKLPDDKAKYQ